MWPAIKWHLFEPTTNWQVCKRENIADISPFISQIHPCAAKFIRVCCMNLSNGQRQSIYCTPDIYFFASVLLFLTNSKRCFYCIYSYSITQNAYTVHKQIFGHDLRFWILQPVLMQIFNHSNEDIPVSYQLYAEKWIYMWQPDASFYVWR